MGPYKFLQGPYPVFSEYKRLVQAAQKIEDPTFDETQEILQGLEVVDWKLSFLDTLEEEWNKSSEDMTPEDRLARLCTAPCLDEWQKSLLEDFTLGRLNAERRCLKIRKERLMSRMPSQTEKSVVSVELESPQETFSGW